MISNAFADERILDQRPVFVWLEVRYGDRFSVAMGETVDPKIVLGNCNASIDDERAESLWRESGCGWLTGNDVHVPGNLVRRVVGLVNSLDSKGSGLRRLTTAEGLGLLAERAAFMGLPPAGTRSAGGASRFLRCTDGWLVLTLARDDDLALLPAWLEADLGTIDPWQSVSLAVGQRRRNELVDRGAELGLPCAAVGEVTDARPVLAERFGDAAPGSLRGATVVNLASLWAGPLCADVMARLGCRVITVESTQRPDGGRLARRFFEALHGRTESCAIDLSQDAGRAILHRMLERADIVIEGSRPRALEQMGIFAKELIERGPRVWLSITAHGRVGAEASRVGFGDDAAAAGGLVGWVGGHPRFVADAVADPLTGLTAAHSIATLVERGGRWLVDVALSRVACSAVGGGIEPVLGVPVARPQPRSDPGGHLPLGRDTQLVLESLAVV